MINFSDLLEVRTVLVFVLALLIVTLYLNTKLPKNFPPGPRPLPIIGNLLSLGNNPDKINMSFAELSKKYGPIVGLKMGSYPTVVLNSLDVIKEALVKKGDHFRNRPHFLHYMTQATQIGGQGPVRGVAWTNGELWKSSRRFTLSSMRDFGLGKKTIEGKIQEEAVFMCSELAKVTGQFFDVTLLFQELVSNIICSICFGSRFEYTDPVFTQLMEMIRFNFKSDALATAGNFIPLLRILPEQEQFQKAMANVAEADKWLKMNVEKHRETFDPKEIRDFVDLYLANEDKNVEALCPENMQRVILDLFITGSETTASGLRWILLFLIHNPDIQRKVKDELDHVIGQSRPPCLADREHVPYTDAVIHESLRLGNISSFGVPHAAECDTTLGGYNIPKGTMVIANLSSVHLSSKHFKNPEQFQPERWIGSNGKILKNEALIAFGMGPRVCIGESLARSEMFLFLTSMLQRFSFRMPDPNNPPSLEGKQGITLTPRKFDVIIESC